MSDLSAKAKASPNIAFIKYWGDRDPDLRIPANSSISMNLADLFTITSVAFQADLKADHLILNTRTISGTGLARVRKFLDRVRSMAGIDWFARVNSENNFPIGAGIASSASAFASLALAASSAAGLELSEAQLSSLARTGSGSACRSLPGGFVEWQAGDDHYSSYAFSIAPPEHWDLVDCIAIVSQVSKSIGSTEGHALAKTSPLQNSRLEDTPRRLEICRQAILNRDFEALAYICELDSNMMHAVMMTSSPPLLYWQPGTVEIMQAVQTWRKEGLPVFYTIDAGPNVHVLCQASFTEKITQKLEQIPGISKVLTSHPGGPAQLLAS
ncbi:MAG: diphosphomevalonate decarboxylase [Anaerolineales bacterium]|nr:diphosphomevalonate decarboxylase [Anaerolineales bacterium]